MNNPQTQHIFMMDHVKRESAYRPGEDFAAWQKAAREKLGALLGMKVWRHKTKHWHFVWGVPAILIAQLALGVWLIWKF